jgi:hypothetical protein
MLMRHELRVVAVMAMLVGSGGFGYAQIAVPAVSDQLSLTQAQELTILLRVENERPQPAAAPAEVGAKVSDEVALKRLPSDVGAQIPEAERFHYAKLEDKVLLVDPANKQVVKVIRPQASGVSPLPGAGATTGAGR